MNAAVADQSKKCVASGLDVNLDPTKIDKNASLLEGEIDIDSTAVVELISLIEEKLNISFTEGELVPDSSSTMAALAGLVPKKLEGSCPSGAPQPMGS